MLISGCNIQNTLLYFPSARRPTSAAMAAAQLKPWPSISLDEYRGLIATREPTKVHGTAIVFHGNAGTAIDRAFYAEMLTGLGYRTILAEYPEYGGRKGSLGEKAFVADAAESLRLAHEQFPPPLFLVGESLGCGVAAAVSAQSPVPIAGLILITPWDTLAAIARTKFPLLPIGFLLSDRYDNIANLKSFGGRIVVVGAEFDDIVPVIHADNLFRSLTNPGKRMVRIARAGHNDILYHTNRQWWQEVMDFVDGSGKE